MRVFKSLTLAFLLGAAAQAGLAQTPPQITVTGEGRVDAAPDMATISLGLTSEAKSAAEAMAASSAKMTIVLDNLRAAGIADRDLQTSGLSLNPNWTNYSSSDTPKITGYTANNQLSIRVRALETLGSLLDAAITDGANTLNGVSFGLADPAPALDEARKRAVADARHRAELLATAAGVTLGSIQSITEGGGYSQPQPQFRMAADSAPVPMAEGEVSVAASVTIIWQIAN